MIVLTGHLRGGRGHLQRLQSLGCPEFGKLLACARPGGTMHISEMFCLVRGARRILDVLDVLHQGRLALRNHGGAFARTVCRRPGGGTENNASMLACL
ncbi:hypothetical protein [Streptomyces atratus]|uniref:hypothetical protein n=1 Tax=Streptomyces atratus TaxID=1893 RepID=UPI001E2FCE80|nr:hypothetical protein [Streptomyces atratus]